MKPQRDSYSCKGIVSLGIFEEKWMSSTSEYVVYSSEGTGNSTVRGVLPPFGHFQQNKFRCFLKPH